MLFLPGRQRQPGDVFRKQTDTAKLQQQVYTTLDLMFKIQYQSLGEHTPV